jgi:hypothetical protein
MNRALLVLILVLVASACGDASVEPANGTSAAIRLQAQLESSTHSITVRVFAPRDRENVIVTCTSLLSGNPLDDRYEVLQSAEFDYPPVAGASIVVSNVDAKDGVVVYVDARNATDQVIGEGCEAGIDVKGGETANVDITIYPAS